MDDAGESQPHRPRGSARGPRVPGHWLTWKELFVALRHEWTQDRLTDLAGMVTFYGILALFPFLLFLVTLAGLLIDPSFEADLVDHLARVAPDAVTTILGERVRSLARSSNAGLLTASAAFAVWSASGGIAALARGLNATHGIRDSRPWWKRRALAVGMTFFAAGLALVAALIAIVTPPLARMIGGPIGTALLWIRLPLAGLLTMFLWACLYYFLPDAKRRFRLVTPGSVAGVLLWLLASWAFSVYVSNFGRYEVTYGALGGVVVMLVWMWISAHALLLGAEIDGVLERHPPEDREPTRGALNASRPRASGPRPAPPSAPPPP